MLASAEFVLENRGSGSPDGGPGGRDDGDGAALARAMSPGELLGAVDRLVKAGTIGDAVALYRSWIRHNPDSPLLYAMIFNCGMLLSNSGEFAAAQTMLHECIVARPDFLPAQINLGLVLERTGAVGEAVVCWQQVAACLQHVNGETLTQKRMTLKQLGRVFESVHFDPSAEAVMRQSLEIDPQQRDVLQHWLALRQRQCEWPVIAPFGDLRHEQMLASMPPLTLASFSDDPLLQRATAAEYHRVDVMQQQRPVRSTVQCPPSGDRSRKLRVGYLSSDLRDHAVGYLIVEIFELHDRRAVEVFAYYTGHAVVDDLQARIKSTVDHWRDLAEMDDAAASRAIMDDEIDILVDVNGYTYGARTQLLARRPAPIIVNWLGFPGTTGSPDHHYIVADDFIVPPGAEPYYSEAVLRLPCYQPNDRRRYSSASIPSRAEAGLPDEGVVYCCFNGAQKFTRFTWRRWMTILQQVPGSVLWLMEGVATTNDRLRGMAAEHGVAPDRLVFAGRRSNGDHLARYKLAHLFLDTTPYNAHTTASDALWMGLPILTLAGRSFASRVCGSLARSAGIGELVCATSEQYVALAVELGRDPARLAALRQRLERDRDTCVLFDTPRLVAALEAQYRRIWQAALADDLPRPHLPRSSFPYSVSAALESDDRELIATDYHARYRSYVAETACAETACAETARAGT